MFSSSCLQFDINPEDNVIYVCDGDSVPKFPASAIHGEMSEPVVGI